MLSLQEGGVCKLNLLKSLAETGNNPSIVYHVFKEGELDYLINTYVENLHIISSYHDHSNWCVVAEKVNVWTI